VKISANNINFKGYDALPLKKLHIASSWGKIEDELFDVSKKEGFEVKTSIYNGSFNQDCKVILERDKKPFLLMEECGDFFQEHVPAIMLQYEMNAQLFSLNQRNLGFVQGGNFFIGKYPNGEKWMMIGSREKFFSDRISQISKFYDIKEENIFYVQQQDYHLDLSVRPIGYPYVLVNNPKLALEYRNKAHGYNKPLNNRELDKIAPQMAIYKRNIKELERAGFKPIPIGGVFEAGINFINAVVNMHEDKSISYITNSSKCDSKNISKYQDIFEQELRKKLKQIGLTDKNSPKLRDIYFIQGENYGESNELMDNLIGGAGGIHCMSLEEPNFDVWV